MGSASFCAHVPVQPRSSSLPPEPDSPGLLTCLVFKNRTVSSVFCMSGSWSFRLTTRRCRFCSMNWYFLDACRAPCQHRQSGTVRPEPERRGARTRSSPGSCAAWARHRRATPGSLRPCRQTGPPECPEGWSPPRHLWHCRKSLSKGNGRVRGHSVHRNTHDEAGFVALLAIAEMSWKFFWRPRRMDNPWKDSDARAWGEQAF